jgi:hypothetical protein
MGERGSCVLTRGVIFRVVCSESGRARLLPREKSARQEPRPPETRPSGTDSKFVSKHLPRRSNRPEFSKAQKLTKYTGVKGTLDTGHGGQSVPRKRVWAYLSASASSKATRGRSRPPTALAEEPSSASGFPVPNNRCQVRGESVLLDAGCNESRIGSSSASNESRLASPFKSAAYSMSKRCNPVHPQERRQTWHRSLKRWTRAARRRSRSAA